MLVDILLICHDADRGDTKNGLPYSKLIDSLHEEFMAKGYNCLQVGLPRAKLVNEKAWGKPLSFESFFPNQSFYNRIISKIIYKLIKVININVNLKKIFIPEDKVNCWLKIFQTINPKIIFTIGATSEMCRAAKKLDITLVEVLHGIGYTRIEWGWSQKPYLELPNVILCLDYISKKSFKPLENQGVIIREIPHPWYKRFYDNNLSLYRDYFCFDYLRFIPPTVKKVILISLQWRYDGDHGEYIEFSNIVPNGLLPDALIHAIEDTKEDIFYCIRRHPVQLMQKKYRKQIKFLDNFISTHSNCEYIYSSKSTLASLLQKVDGHITLSSMVSYEAAMMGIKTLLLCPTLLIGGKNEALFEDLVSSGYANKILLNKNQIVDWLNSVEKIESLSLTDAKETDWELFVTDFISNQVN